MDKYLGDGSSKPPEPCEALFRHWKGANRSRQAYAKVRQQIMGTKWYGRTENEKFIKKIRVKNDSAAFLVDLAVGSRVTSF